MLVLERVRKTISRYNMLPRGSRAIVALSGGPDSVCLLHLLIELAPKLGVEVEAAHLNHQLRGEESDADEQFVKALAERLGVKLHCSRVDVAARIEASGGNLEQAARVARQEFFRELRGRSGNVCIATGHTRDDQAETVLLRILRGSGLAGLAGIHPVTASGIVRPLLDVTRAGVLQFLETRGETWREDSSNRDVRFSRNAIRHETLPQLSARWNPNLGEALAHLADITFEEERWWRSGGSPLAAIPQTCAAGGVELDVGTLARLPKAVQRRVIRRAMAAAKGDLRQVDFDHIERIVELAAAPQGTGRLELPGLNVQRSFDLIRFAQPQKRSPIESLPVEVPGSIPSPDAKSLIHLKLADAQCGADPCDNLKSELIRLGRAPTKLQLRGWRPGDRYRPRGGTRVRKLNEMFADARVPSWQRPYWPILTNGDEIVWARQFGAAGEIPNGIGLVVEVSETKSQANESFDGDISS